MPASRRVFWLWAWLSLSALLLIAVLVVTLRFLWRQDVERLRTESEARAVDLARQIEETLADVEGPLASRLAGFHLEGLRPQLEQWAASSELVTGAFVAPRGGAPLWTSVEGLEPILRREGAWVWDRPAAREREYPLDPQGSHFGYLSDNLEILAYDGQPVNPTVGWWVDPADPAAPWICWHRLGPESEVRGCAVDPSQIIEGLRAVLAADPAGAVELVWQPAQVYKSIAPESLTHLVHPLGGSTPAARLMASYALVLQPAGAASARRFHFLLWVVVSGVAGLFLLGVILLIRQTRSEATEARRRVTFVSQVSHELRTPLTSIRLFAEMLQKEALPAEKRLRFARTIIGESQRLSSLIERLLTFNALERSTQTFDCRTLPLGPVLAECLEELRPTLEAAGMTALFEGESSPVTAHFDPGALKQVVLNLLDNAVKYAAAGGVVSIALEGREQAVEIAVADRGPGIPRSLRDRVFEPFVQGARELHTKQPGVGLGLSISRGLLRGFGGDLVLAPAGDPGARFVIQLPLPHDSPSA